MDVSFIDDDAEATPGVDGPIDSYNQRPVTDDVPEASPRAFNPTEAILATMQLLPLPCAAKAPAGAKRPGAAGRMPPRRKSKSQAGLDALGDDRTPDAEELRSFQRQLQNVPSVSELRRKPMERRRSPSPAASERSLDAAVRAASRCLSKTRSASSSASGRSVGTESHALAILNFVKVSGFVAMTTRPTLASTLN